MTTTSAAYPVQLRVYDVLRGFGSQLNVGVWHTGVLVHEHEFFFGGGIACLPNGRFEMEHGILVSKVIEMGTTTKTLEEIQSWVRSVDGQWTMESYDLIQRNCNHFSNALLKWLLNREDDCVPREILHQHEFLPPFAQQFLPLIQSLQNQFTATAIPGFQAPQIPATIPPSTSSNATGPQRPPPQPRNVPTPFSQKLDQLAACPATSIAAKKEAVDVLCTLAKNAKENATEIKYRTVKSTNPRVAALLSVQYGKECLEELGFKSSGDGSYSLGNSLNFEVLAGLQVAVNYCNKVLEEFKDFENGKYSDQISILKGMGFENEFASYKALSKSRGLIDGALDHLTV